MIIDLGTLGRNDSLTIHATLSDCYQAGAEYLNHAHKLLEIGPGIRPIILEFPPDLRVLIEPSNAYCSVLSRIFGRRENTVVINQDALTFLASLPDSSFDVIVLSDVIEHLEKEDGLKLIEELQRVSSSTVGIFTPLGFMPQHFTSARDTWGFSEAALQTHRSGWLPKDFSDAWRFEVVQKAHIAANGEEFGAMWAIYIKQVIKTENKTLAFSPRFELDRDSAIFEFSHSQDTAEVVSNGYTRLAPNLKNKVEYGSNNYFEGVTLKHKQNRRLKISFPSLLKLLIFRLIILKKKKNIRYFNLNRVEKILLGRRRK